MSDTNATSTVSQTESVLVFDDLMALTPCHVNCIPTDFYIPDFRPLLERPAAVSSQNIFESCLPPHLLNIENVHL